MQRDIKFVFIIFMIFLSIFVWQGVFISNNNTEDFIEISFFDIGQGDASFIELPGENQILIDGGPDNNVLEKIAEEMPFLDNKIELIILTHPDKDHINGLFEVLEIYEVEKVLLPEIIGESSQKLLYSSFLELLAKNKIDYFFAKTGQKINFSQGGEFLILWPEDNFSSKDTNDFSIICKFSFGDIDFLFTGDAPHEVEHTLLSKNFDIKSEVLKVGHHGSKHSTSEFFLKDILPKIAIISSGENNSYGHPAEEVLERLKKYGIYQILKTADNGNIKIISDGKNYQVLENNIY